MSTLGQRIRRRREELNLTQQELAERLGYRSKVSVSNAENDRDDMTTTRISKYAEALEVSEAYLMGWTEEDNDYDIIGVGMNEAIMRAYATRGFWAYHLLDIGDHIPQAGVNELLSYADFLASKYGATDLATPEQVEKAFFSNGKEE